MFVVIIVVSNFKENLMLTSKTL